MSQKIQIQVLGTGCMKCNKLFADVEQAIAQAGVSAELSKVEKLEEIVKFGVAFTPGLVIDGEVKSQGKAPDTAQIVAWIQEAAGK
jgi:small redox-active disulfide protein 2